jgi:hypothetical protein
MAQNDADNDAGIEGPQFDQGSMISPTPLSPSRSRLITPQEFHNAVQCHIQQLQEWMVNLIQRFLICGILFSKNWDRYSDAER